MWKLTGSGPSKLVGPKVEVMSESRSVPIPVSFSSLSSATT